MSLAEVMLVGINEQFQQALGKAYVSKTLSADAKNSTCTIQISLELTEPEALADFLRRGSASASGSMDCIGKFKFNRTGRKNSLESTNGQEEETRSSGVTVATSC